MSSSVESSNVVGSSLTCTASGSASQSSDDPSYDWVDPSVLRIPSKIKSSDDLDEFLSTHKDFLAADCPTEALTVDICGMTDRVCHSRENAPHDFFFVYSTFFSHLHVSLRQLHYECSSYPQHCTNPVTSKFVGNFTSLSNHLPNFWPYANS